MGYHVWINFEGNSAALMRKLRHSPAGLFSKPYYGYMFFLIGGGEKELLDWLMENIYQIDSVTNEDIAFCVFMKEYKFKATATVNPGKGPSYDRPIREDDRKVFIDIVHQWGIYNITKFEFEGTEVKAITYGVDEVARNLNLLDQLPCIVFLDPLPKPKFFVYPVDQINLNELIPLLRTSIQRLRNHKNYNDFMKNMQTVEKLHKLIEQYNQEILNTKKWIWGVSIEKLLLPYQSLVKEFEVALSKGRMSMLKGSKIYNTFPLDNKILSRKEFDSAYQKAVNVSAQLIQIKRTIQRLSIYAHKYPWPLQDTEKNRLGNVVQKFVSPYIPVIDSIDITKENLISWGNDLEICQQTIIKDVMSLLPNSAEAENRALKEIEHRRKYIAEEIERIEERKSPLTAQIKALSHELYSDQQPSFIKIVSERTKEEKIDAYFKQAMDTAKTYMGSWLKPEIFLDVLRSSHP